MIAVETGTTAAYSYQAVDSAGQISRGTIHASSRDAALTAVRERGLLPMEVRVASRVTDHRTRVPPADLALGLRVLSDLLDAGLPMSRALAAFEELAPPSWGPGMVTLHAAVREGRTLASALIASGLDVPPLVLGVIQAGEAGAGLASAVRRAADFTETTAATRSAIRSALAYPALLAGAGSGALALLVGVVLPRFANILSDLGQSLPPTTQVVLQTAHILRLAVLPAFITLVILALAWRAWTATTEGRRRWHELLLSLPIIGNVRHAAATAHATAALASLLESGVPLPVALTHAARATGDGALNARLLLAREHVLTGQRIGVALGDTRALTPTAIRLVRAGEDTGRLASMLRHAAKLEGERAQQLVKSAVRLLEPAMIIAFGAIIAFVAAALLQAVYSVRPSA